MADDTTKKDGGLFDDAGLNNVADSTKKVADATVRTTNEQEAFLRILERTNRALRDTDDNLNNVSLAEQKEEDQKKRLIKIGKDYLDQLTKQLSITNQLGSAVGGYGQKLASALTLNKQYERMIGEVNDAQQRFQGSVEASSDSIDSASQSLQKHIDIIRESKKASADLASKYSVDIKKMDEVNDAVLKKFGARFGAAAKNATQGTKMVKGATESVFVLSRTAGIEAGKALDLMGDLAAGSTKDVKGLQSDMEKLAVVTDQYKQKLKALSKDAFERLAHTAGITVEAISNISKRMQYGAPDVEAYGKVINDTLTTAATKWNFTEKEIRAGAKGLENMFSALAEGGLKEFFSTQQAGEMVHRIEMGEKGVLGPGMEKLEETLKKTFEEQTKLGMSPIEKMEAFQVRAQGNAQLMTATLQGMEKTMNPEVFSKMLRQYGISPTMFLSLKETIQKGTDSTGKISEKAQKEASEKVKNALAKQATPAEKSYKAVTQIRDITQRIERYLSQSLVASLIAGIGSTVAQVVLGKMAQNAALKLAGGGGAPMPDISTGGKKLGREVGRIPGQKVSRLPPSLAKTPVSRLGGAARLAPTRGVGGLTKMFGPLKGMLGGISKLPMGSILGSVAKIAGPLGLIVTAVQILGPALDPVVKAVTKTFKTLSDAFKPLISTIRKALTPVFKILGKWIGFVTNVIVTALKPAIWALTKAFELIGWAAGKLQSGLSWVGSGLSKAWKFISPVFKAVGSAFKSIAGVAGKVAKALSPVLLVFRVLRKGLDYLYRAIMWVYNKTIGRFIKSEGVAEQVGSGASKERIKNIQSQIEEKRALGEDTKDLEERLANERVLLAAIESSDQAKAGAAGPGQQKSTDELLGEWSGAKKGAAGQTGAIPTTALSNMGAKQAEKMSPTVKLALGMEGGGGEGTVQDVKYDDAGGFIEFPGQRISIHSFTPVVAKSMTAATSKGT